MSQTIKVSSRGTVRATFVAAYSAVTLAQITNALPGALSGTFAAEFRTSGAGLTWIVRRSHSPRMRGAHGRPGKDHAGWRGGTDRGRR